MLVIHLRSGNKEHIAFYWRVCQIWGHRNPEEEVSLCENYRVMNLKSAKWDSGRATPGEGLSSASVHTQQATAWRWLQGRTRGFLDNHRNVFSVRFEAFYRSFLSCLHIWNDSILCYLKSLLVRELAVGDISQTVVSCDVGCWTRQDEWGSKSH